MGCFLSCLFDGQIVVHESQFFSNGAAATLSEVGAVHRSRSTDSVTISAVLRSHPQDPKGQLEPPRTQLPATAPPKRRVRTAPRSPGHPDGGTDRYAWSSVAWWASGVGWESLGSLTGWRHARSCVWLGAWQGSAGATRASSTSGPAVQLKAPEVARAPKSSGHRPPLLSERARRDEAGGLARRGIPVDIGKRSFIRPLRRWNRRSAAASCPAPRSAGRHSRDIGACEEQLVLHLWLSPQQHVGHQWASPDHFPLHPALTNANLSLLSFVPFTRAAIDLGPFARIADNVRCPRHPFGQHLSLRNERTRPTLFGSEDLNGLVAHSTTPACLPVRKLRASKMVGNALQCCGAI